MADKLAEKIDKIIPPASELYPKEAKYTVMQQAEIDGLRGEIRPEDPEAQEKKELLDRVQTMTDEEKLQVLSDQSIELQQRFCGPAEMLMRVRCTGRKDGEDRAELLTRHNRSPFSAGPRGPGEPQQSPAAVKEADHVQIHRL